jgi:hypothetical protein
MATTSSLEAITKIWIVQNKVVNQLHSKSVLYDKTAKKQMTDVHGRNYTYAIREGRNRYAGRGISEGGDYGTIGAQTPANIVVPNAEVTTGIELSSRVVNSANAAGKAAFVDAFTFEVKNGMDDTIYSLNRQLHSDGTDALGFWTTADNSSGTNIDDGQGNAFPIHLESGATTLDLIDASDNSTVLGDSIVVTKGAEGASALAITWTGTVSGSAANDYLVMENTLGKQVMGIRGIISASDPPLLSGGLHGLTVASHPTWVSQVFSNSGTKRALTMQLLQQPLTRIGLRSSSTEADIDLMLCNGFFKDKIVELLVADQMSYNTTTLKGGQTSIEFNGKQIVVDAQCRRNTLYYINTDSLDFLTASGGLGFASFEDNSKWQRKIGSSGYAAAYQAFVSIEGNMACTNRSCNAVLLDISD